MMKPEKAALCRKRQPMSDEVEENLRLFFRPFLNTPQGMDVNLGFKSSYWRRPKLPEGKPQIAVHAGVGCQVHYEKVSGKDRQVLAIKPAGQTAVNSCFSNLSCKGCPWRMDHPGRASYLFSGHGHHGSRAGGGPNPSDVPRS